MVKQTIKYRQARFLLSLLEQTSIITFPKEKRKTLYGIKLQLEGVAEKLNQKTTICMLLHGGQEKEGQRGKYYDYPDLPKRENLTDAQYEEKLNKHFEVVAGIKAELKKLADSTCGVEIPRLFTSEEFEDLCTKIGNIELADLEEFLVIK